MMISSGNLWLSIDYLIYSDFEMQAASQIWRLTAYHPFAADTGQDVSKLRMRRRQRIADVPFGGPYFLVLRNGWNDL